MITNGYIRLHRSMTKWEWYHDINTTRLWIHLLMTVNWEDNRFEGVEIPRGSRVCSISKLAAETDLSDREIRTAINHLKATSNVTIKRHAKFSVISIQNFNAYQSDDKVADIGATQERQASDNNLKKQKSKKGSCSCSTARARVREGLPEMISETWDREPSPYELRTICQHLDELDADEQDEPELIEIAIGASSQANRPLQYVLSILRRWKDAQIHTVADYDAYMTRRDTRRARPHKEETVAKTYDLDDMFQAAVARTKNKRKGD